MTVTAVRPPRIADELGELAVRMSAVLLGDHTGGSAVQILTSLSLNAVPNASGAGVTLVGTAAPRPRSQPPPKPFSRPTPCSTT